MFPFANADFVSMMRDPKRLPALSTLPVQVGERVLSAREALQSIDLDGSHLNPEVSAA